MGKAEAREQMRRHMAGRARHLPGSLDDLKGWEGNPRVISDANAERLSLSLDKYGDLSNITFNLQTGHLVGGHQRVERLRKRHGGGLVLVTADGGPLSSVKGERPEYAYLREPGGRSFPVRLVDWDEAKERAANVAANSPDVAGTFQWEELSKLIQGIQTDGGDLADLMLGADTIDPLLMADWAPDPNASVEAFPVEGGEEGSVAVPFTASQWEELLEEVGATSPEQAAEAVLSALRRK